MNFTFPIRIAYKWWVTIAVTLGLLMSLMDSTIVNVAIPQMQRTFGASIHDVQWVVTIYMLTQAAVIPAAPYLTTRFGGKRAYVWTLMAFLFGSLLCGFAWNLPSLIFFRFIQGIGGGILLPMAMTLQYQAFSPEERGTATSTMGVVLMLAPALGPVLGGYLVSSFGWQWAFFINVPLGIVAVIIAQMVLRQKTLAQTKSRFDSAGFLAVAAGSAVLLYAVSTVVGSTAIFGNILFFLGGVLLLLAFVMIERFKVHHGQVPLLDLRRFSDRTFTFSVLTQIIVYFVWFGTLFFLPIYLQTLHQETALQAGAIQGALAVATLVIMPIGGRLADKIGPRTIVITGLIVLTCALALMITLTLNTPIWMIVCILVLLGSASGLTSQIPVTAMSRIEKDEEKEIANASTLLSVLRATAAPMGVAVLASFVQIRSQHYVNSLSTQGITGTVLLHQSTLFAMHESFLISSILIVVSLMVISFVPTRNGNVGARFIAPTRLPHSWGKATGTITTGTITTGDLEHFKPQKKEKQNR